jgi:hypothetical protein
MIWALIKKPIKRPIKTLSERGRELIKERNKTLSKAPQALFARLRPNRHSQAPSCLFIGETEGFQDRRRGEGA